MCICVGVCVCCVLQRERDLHISLAINLTFIPLEWTVDERLLKGEKLLIVVWSLSPLVHAVCGGLNNVIPKYIEL